MNISTTGAVVGLAALLVLDQASGEPTYLSPLARTHVENMIEAHGGLQRWREAPAFSFTVAMYLGSPVVTPDNGRTHSDNWRYYKVAFDPRDGRTAVDIPFEDRAGPEAAFDGEEIWSTDFTYDPLYQEDPIMLMWFHLGLIAMPFFTQYDGVELSYEGRGALPGREGDYDVVRMSFNPPGRRHLGDYKLYLDPDTHLLAAIGQLAFIPIVPNAPMPAVVPTMPFEPLRIFDTYQTIEGITIPRAYTSFGPEIDVFAGAHIVIDSSFSVPLDNRALRRPSDAETYDVNALE